MSRLKSSNTTPLPAKIYANEGIAQILSQSASTFVGKISAMVIITLDNGYQNQLGLDIAICVKLRELDDNSGKPKSQIIG